ncbi:enolase-phosphatase E1-like isoform X1 [Prorops nasuta]|uniref:enolase-phosphatase E1-like isoform X1 n=1 Tax=Prorops nasuta TaxID=863751 RepID=UPI0034CFFE9E
MAGYAWVTLATNDSYSLGALVLGNSLKRVGTKHDLVVLVTPGVTSLMREKLASVFSLVQEVNVLDSKDKANLALLARPELGITFTKLHCWRLTQFEKCVFVDADTLVVRNCDELFEREELSAAPDVGWPDCFNSGVFVFKPSMGTFESIVAFAVSKGSFDGGDQGLLNSYFSDWAWKDISKHLPFIYNMCSTATYSYIPAFKQFGDNVRIIHFIGSTKPWLQYFDTMTGIVQPPQSFNHLQPLLQLWWNIFCELVHPQLTPNMATSTLAPIWHKFTPFFISQVNTPHPDTSYQTQSYIPPELPPDFSEFKDPWENYSFNNEEHVEEANYTDNYQQGHFNQNTELKQSYRIEQIKYDNCKNNFGGQSGSGYCPPKEVSCDQNNYRAYQEHRHDNSSHCQHENQSQERRYDSESHREIQKNYQLNHRVHIQQPETQNFHTTFFNLSLHENQSQERRYDSEPHREIQKNYQSEQQVHFEHNKSTNLHTTDCSFFHHENQSHERRCDSDSHQEIQKNYHLEQRAHFEQTETQHLHTVDCSFCHHENQSQERRYNPESHQPHHQAHFEHTYPSSGETKEKGSHNLETQITHRVLEKESLDNERERNFSESNIVNRNSQSISQSHPIYSDTEPHKVASQSDLIITGLPNKTNAGLAGALAQITLGQPRSAEQIAFEEHMRKQSWEQGQIDFMGRDSFENIWKKICDTLSQAPQRQPTPPKESVEPKLEVEPEVEQITTDTAALSLETQTDKKAEEEPPSSQKIIENILEEKITEDIAATEPDYSKEVVNPILVAIQANVDQLCTELTSKLLESAAPVEETEEKSDKTSELIEATLENVDICPLTVSSEKAEIKSDKTVGSIEKALENIDVCPLTITPEKAEVKSDDTVESIEKAIENIDICPLSVSSEIISKEELLKESDKCPVPIQVAESVLQAEPKESVSEVPKPVEQIISSSVDILQEAVASRAEILAQATGLAPVSDLKNGDLEEGQEVSPLLTENRRVSLKSELLLTEDREQNVQLQTSANDSVEEKLKEPEPETIQSKELLQEPEQKLEIPLQELTSAVVEQEKKLESKIPTEGLKSEAEEQKTIIQAEEVKSESESKPAEIQEQKLTTESEVKTEIPVQELKSESETKSEAPVQELKAEPKPETLSQEIKSESEHKPEILSEESKLQGTELQSVPVELTTETKEVDTEATVQRPESTTEEQQVSVEGVTSEGQIPKKSVVAKGKDLELEIPPKTLEMAGDSGKLDIPPTPTVTEPTPPTSPPIQPEDVERSVKKNVKKVIKKTSSEDAGDAEGDSSGKKVTKKVVKKVIKKKDSEESQEGDKPKKPAKTAKKVAKPSPSLGPDTSVPETPPPASTSETPVPPKRKAKASTAKAATKSESES